MEEWLVPIAFFATVATIIHFVIQSNLKRTKMEHEERMLAIERGIPLPPHPEKKVRNPYKWPAILIAIGLAMFYAMLVQGDDDWAWGVMPILIGVGLVMAHLRNMRDRHKQEKAKELPSLAWPAPEKQPSAE